MGLVYTPLIKSGSLCVELLRFITLPLCQAKACSVDKVLLFTALNDLLFIMM